MLSPSYFIFICFPFSFFFHIKKKGLIYMTTTITTANSIIGYKVGNSYKIGAKIGSGSFGEIHKGKETNSR